LKKYRQEKTGYVVAIIFNLILLYLFNNLLTWHVYFVTNALNSVLWIINFSIIVAVIGNALLLLYNPELFRHLMTTIINIFAFVAIFFLYKVFPFNFNNFYIYWGLNILLIMIMIGLAISIIVELYYLMTRISKINSN
jgi:hypothetical protein